MTWPVGPTASASHTSGIDRSETMGHWESLDDVRAAASGAPGVGGASSTPWHFDDPGENIGPKSNDLWKPVVAAINGMACGGAFYILGESTSSSPPSTRPSSTRTPRSA